MYECPAGEVLRTAHVGLEGLCLDREVYRLRDTLASRFTDYCYNGFWFSPEMEFVLHAVEKSQEVRAMWVCCCVWCRALTWFGQNVTGTVDIELFKGKASIRSRSSPLSLYSEVLYDKHVSVCGVSYTRSSPGGMCGRLLRPWIPLAPTTQPTPLGSSTSTLTA